jgi:hypothetical protein
MSNIEDEFVEREAKMRGLTIPQYLAQRAIPNSLARDLMADARRGISNSASMIPDRERSKPVQRGSGWTPDVPIKQPPGAEPGGLIDRMVEADTQRQRHEAQVKINMQAAEELRLLELQQRRRDHELDPYDTGIYGPTYDNEK